jgi:hypothetical protein
MNADERFRALLREIAWAANEVRWALYGGWLGAILFILVLKGY